MSISNCRIRVLRRRNYFGAAAATTMCWALPAFAQPYYVRAHTRVTTSGFGICDPQFQDDNTGQLQTSATSSGPFTVVSHESNCATATATAYGWAELGVLGGDVSYSASTSGAPAGAGGQGTPESWGDTITFLSDTLPEGSPVMYEATLTFNRTMSASGATVIQTSANGPNGLYIFDSFNIPNPTVTQTVTGSWFIGFSMPIQVSLFFEASGTAFMNDAASGSIHVQSVVFTLQTITPNTYYTTASGMSYVPLLDADVNVSGAGDGEDIGPFVVALLAESTSASDLYHADFNGSGIIDTGDIEGFALTLVGL